MSELPRYGDLVDRDEMVMSMLLERRAEQDPNRLYLRFGKQRLTVGEVDQAARRIGNALAARSVGPGDKVAIISENRPEIYYVAFGLGRIGGVEVPVNTAYKGTMLEYVLQNCEASVVIADRAGMLRLAEVVDHLPKLKRVIALDAIPAQWKRVNQIELENFSALSLDTSPDFSTERSYADVVQILYTSGTTGPSKGVLITSRQQVLTGLIFAEVVQNVQEDVVYNHLPHFHVVNRFIATACLAVGSSMVLLPRFSLTGFWSDVHAFQVTTLCAIGGVAEMLMSRTPDSEEMNNPLRVVYAIPPPRAFNEFERRFGCAVVSAYGQTETTIVIASSMGDSSPSATMGRARPEFDLKIVDPHDEPVPDGQAGELLVRSKLPYSMASGYYNMPEATLEAMRNLWWHTGDRVYQDSEGYYFFVDRVRDAMRRRGENISSFEVERALLAHPDVVDAAAVGVPSPVGDEDVKVIVTKRAGSPLTHVDLLRHCVANLAYFAVPRFIEFVDELPRTPTEKVKKYELRALGITAHTWDREAEGYAVTRDGLVESGQADLRARHGK